MSVFRTAMFLSVLTVLAQISVVMAEDSANPWPQILGPQRNGRSMETGLIDKLPAEGIKAKWRVSGGVGMSAIVISRGKALTLVQREGKQQLIALDATTGEALWQAPLAPAYENSMGNGPRATPTIAGELVFTFTGEGILTASKFSDGTAIWSRNCVQELKGEIAEYGMACSPLVVGDLVIVTVGAPNACVVAYQATTGKQVWAAGNDAAGYSSPALLEFPAFPGHPQLVAFTGGSLLGLNPKTGASLWSYPYETNYECNIATPLAIKNDIFISAGENHGSTLLALKGTGDKFAVKEVWTSQGVKSVLRNEWQTSILLDGYLYGMDNVGGAGPITHLTCIDAATGERKWQQARFGKGNLIEAEGKLFISTMKGELVLVKANPQAYQELGRSELLGSTRQAPALANGLLYLRDDKEIVCVDVRRK